MELQQERPPAYSHDPDTLHLPSVPSQDLIPPASIHLPDLKSLGLPEATPLRHQKPSSNGFQPVVALSQSASDAAQWNFTHPLQASTFPRVPATELRPVGIEADIGSPMSSVMSVEDALHHKTVNTASIEDPDVRLAAEGLSALCNPDFVRSPSSRSVTLPPTQTKASSSTQYSQSQEAEPLLSLLTSSHPWIGGTINGSLSAYSSTKHYSPRFIQYGAEFVERNLGSPVVNTVSSMGKRTGVEGSLRRYLGSHRRSSENDNQQDEANSNKRRRMAPADPDAMDIERGLASPSANTRMRCDSQSSNAESLPAYDDQRSPSYEEVSMKDAPPPSTHESDPNQRANWSTQLMLTTSGLGVALSESSLASLKLCLRLLRSATHHVDTVMKALKLLLEDYEKALQSENMNGADSADRKDLISGPEREERCRQIADRIKAYGEDIWRTVKTVVASVSRYTGGVLPENAGVYVRSQLMSVPQRWRSVAANQSQGGADEVQTGAHRMLAFAKEGLDMMAQVSRVVDGTIVSAEAWLDRMGKKRPREEGPLLGDIKDPNLMQPTSPLPIGDNQTVLATNTDKKMQLL